MNGPDLSIPIWVWLATIGGVVGLLGFDLLLGGRKRHVVGMGEAARWVTFYVACAIVFGLGLWYFTNDTYGATYALEYFAGYITEYSLSVDNLFVFVIIMTAFAVPADRQHQVLLVGIVLALIMRGIFIALGAAAIAAFSEVFYVFGAFLIFTAYKLAAHRNDEADYQENAALRWLRKVMPVTEDYQGSKLIVKFDGKRWATPMLIVMVAIGSTDLLFALDSIPAIYGLTEEPFLVFAANAFALMGLRQLYFLLGGLLNKLVYLSIGLAAILGFIGVKLILHALHENGVPVPEVPTSLSLAVIVLVLTVTTVASLIKVRRDPSAAKDAGVTAPPDGEQDGAGTDGSQQRRGDHRAEIPDP